MKDPVDTIRLSVAHEAWKRAQAEVDVARETLQRELIAAVNNGVRKAEIARLFGVSRQAVDDYLRWGKRER
jgi:DNA invertase Pin-like site-specific DNA recombinase